MEYMWDIVDGSGEWNEYLTILLIIFPPNPLLTNINIYDILPNPHIKTYKKSQKIHK
jgi:hypothetical protein